MENKDKNVFDKTIQTLKEDCITLTKRYDNLVNLEFDLNNQVTYNKAAIDTLRLLKDCLSLIKEYDWHLEYSEYETDGHNEIAIWEQNHAGEIRNHKKFEVGKSVIYIDPEIDKALVYMDGRKYVLSYKPNDDGNIPLIDFLNELDLSRIVYVDSHGFGEYICDLLKKNDIIYRTMRIR